MTNVVVLGGGYAGLSFIRGLQRDGGQNLTVTLVDRNPYHTLLTETHTVAAGSQGPAAVELPLLGLVGNVGLVEAEVTFVDADRRVVHTSAGDVPYDYLAFCLGGTDHDFGLPGVRQHALCLRSVRDAERIWDRVRTLSEGAGIVIAGGGLTGVELAAELATHLKGARPITLLEASPTLLPGLTPALQRRARQRLGWLGVNVMTGARVTEVTPSQVHLADGSLLACGVTVWTAGIKGHPLVAAMGAAVDRSGRAEVDGSLRSSLPGVYVLGDSALFRLRPEEPPVPPSGQLAEQMGFAAAADLADRLRDGEGVRFAPQLKGILCDLGGLNASGLVYRFEVHGLLGALAKRASVLAHVWRVAGPRGLWLHLRNHGRSRDEAAEPERCG